MKLAYTLATQAAWIGALVAVGMVAATKPAAAHHPIVTPGRHVVYGVGAEAPAGHPRTRASATGGAVPPLTTTLWASLALFC